jgi:hypothetical protein
MVAIKPPATPPHSITTIERSPRTRWNLYVYNHSRCYYLYNARQSIYLSFVYHVFSDPQRIEGYFHHGLHSFSATRAMTCPSHLRHGGASKTLLCAFRTYHRQNFARSYCSANMLSEIGFIKGRYSYLLCSKVILGDVLKTSELSRRL